MLLVLLKFQNTIYFMFESKQEANLRNIALIFKEFT